MKPISKDGDDNGDEEEKSAENTGDKVAHKKNLSDLDVSYTYIKKKGSFC